MASMTNADPDQPLVLGPVLRYVDETSATVWARTSTSARVSVERAGRTWSAPTVAVHGPHYALVVLEGLVPGSDDTYTVAVDDERVWPKDGMPPSRIRTLDPTREPHFAFGTCRTTGSHDAEGNKGTVSTRCVPSRSRCRTTRDGVAAPAALPRGPGLRRRHPEAMREFIAARRSLDEPPGEELKDYVEYAAPLPAGLERTRHPLAAVDGAERR